MENQVKENGQLKNVKADRLPKFVAGNPVNQLSKAKEKTTELKEEGTKEPQSPANANPLAAEGIKPVLNLDETIKLLETLHCKKIQRDRLLHTISTLESFKLDLEKDADETGGNHYQGCVLKITDDERNEFSTKNPVIIQAVAQFVNSLCIDKLGEIEASIMLPS